MLVFRRKCKNRTHSYTIPHTGNKIRRYTTDLKNTRRKRKSMPFAVKAETFIREEYMMCRTSFGRRLLVFRGSPPPLDLS